VSLPRREAYDRWAPVYPPAPHNALMLAEQEAVTPLLGVRTIERALDVGAGTGRYTPIVRAAGASVVVSLDWSLAMLRAHAHSALRVCGDARSLPFACGAFDLINASLVAGDVTKLGPWVGELSRVLAPGGRLVYSDFHPAWHTGGWQRTFRDAAGQIVVLPYEPHNLEDHRRASVDAGLVIETIHEVRVPSPPGFVDRWLGRNGMKVPGLVVVAAARRRWGGS